MFLEIVLVLIIVLLAWVVLFLVTKQNNRGSENSLKLIQDHIFNLSKTFDNRIRETNRFLDAKLSETNKTLDAKLSESSKLLSDNMTKTFATSTKINKEANERIETITKKLTELSETNKQIKDIWWQLAWLESILKNPKQRGNLWEYFLKELLENVFNEEQYSLQYQLDWVWIVDAALFIWKKIIPIDSKFPQDNYEKLVSSEDEYSSKKYSTKLKKDIINRIDETSKYVLPEMWTTDFAFMLIPAEWLYYDLFINKVWELNVKKIIEHAFSKKVIICSPSSFYAYLQTVIQGMKALQIEEHAIAIQKHVIKLQKDLEKYEDWYKKIWKSLSATVNHYNSGYKRLWIIDKDIVKITEWEAWWSMEVLELDNPEI